MSGCGVSVLVHGPSKSGKTWLGESAPGPRLILDAEGGTRFLKSRKVVWDPRQPPPTDLDDDTTVLVYIRDFGSLAHAYQWLAAGKHPFKSVILDSISEIQQRCIDALVGTDQMKLQDWGTLSRQVARLVRDYRDLLIHPTKPVEVVVFVAMTRQDQNGKYTPYVQGQLATSLPFYIDIIGFMRAQPDESGEMQRYLLVQPHQNYEAGDRTGVFPPIVNNPDLSVMLKEVCE